MNRQTHRQDSFGIASATPKLKPLLTHWAPEKSDHNQIGREGIHAQFTII